MPGRNNRSSSSTSTASSTSTSAGVHGRDDSSSSNQPAANRRRTILTPLDPELLNSTLMSSIDEVNINSLRSGNDDIFEMDLDTNYLDVQLIRIITPNMNQRASVYGIKRRNNNQDIHFSRLFLCRLHSDTNLNEMSKLIYLMEARNSNNMLFDRNIDHRDDGTFTIGTYFRVIAPLPIENSMRGDIPLVQTQTPVIVMERPSIVTTVSINMQIKENHSMAFVLNGVQINVNRSVPIQTTCGGFLCDKQRVQDWNGQRGCGCYNMTQYRSNLVFEHSINFKKEEVKGGRVSHGNFSSYRFSQLYLSGEIPSGVRISALRISDAYWGIQKTVRNVVKYINENGGWTVVGWYKRGVISDRSLLEPRSTSSAGPTPATNNSAASSTNVDSEVGSGQVGFHIVELAPTDSTYIQAGTLKFNTLKTKKFDVSNINQA